VLHFISNIGHLATTVVITLEKKVDSGEMRSVEGKYLMMLRMDVRCTSKVMAQMVATRQLELVIVADVGDRVV